MAGLGDSMESDIGEADEAVIRRAARLAATYGEVSQDPGDHDPALRVAKRPEWQGFKIKLRAPEAAEGLAGFLRIRRNGELMLYARLARGWEEDMGRVSDLRARPGDWRARLLELR